MVAPKQALIIKPSTEGLLLHQVRVPATKLNNAGCRRLNCIELIQVFFVLHYIKHHSTKLVFLCAKLNIFHFQFLNLVSIRSFYVTNKSTSTFIINSIHTINFLTNPHHYSRIYIKQIWSSRHEKCYLLQMPACIRPRQGKKDENKATSRKGS